MSATLEDGETRLALYEVLHNGKVSRSLYQPTEDRPLYWDAVSMYDEPSDLIGDGSLVEKNFYEFVDVESDQVQLIERHIFDAAFAKAQREVARKPLFFDLN